MTVKELNVGDVFRVVGEEQLWRKMSPTEARQLGAKANKLRAPGVWYNASPLMVGLGTFKDEDIEVVERASEICRAENTLILRGGEVTLEYIGAWRVHRYVPGDKFTEFVLAGDSFSHCRAKEPSSETALAFKVGVGAKELGRSTGSELFAYDGRVYARATKKEVVGGGSAGGYKRIRVIDGASRVVIAGMLIIPSEFALYDIMMEHFGPDTVTPK